MPVTTDINTIDPTLSSTLNALISWATDQKNTAMSAGDTSARLSWALFGSVTSVATKAALPVPEAGTYTIGQLGFVTDENALYQLITVKNKTTPEWTRIDETGGALFSYEMFHYLLSKDRLEGIYKDMYNKKGGRSDLIILAKLQMDFLSAFERDFRYRHRTALRSRFHAAALKRVAANTRGTIEVIRTFLTLSYKQAGVKPLS